MAEPLKIFSLLDFYNIKYKNRIQLGTEYPSLNSCNEGDLYIWHKPLSDEPTQPAEPYNEALALVGIDSVDSLNMVLTNSDYCTALANNTEAYTLMKNNYSTEMTAAIDSSWNEGLNTLNYKCNLKCWLFKAGNQCTGITGGWTTGNKGYVSGSALGVNNGSSSYSTVSTNNKLSGSFSTIYFVVTSTNGKVRLGMSYTKSAHNTTDYEWYVNSETSGTKSGSFVNNAYACMFNGDSKSDLYCHISNIYIIP